MVCDTRHEHSKGSIGSALSVAAYPCHHRLAVLAQDRRNLFFEVRIELRAVHPMIRQPRHDAAVVLPAAGRHLIAASVHLSARSLLALLEECKPDRSNDRAADNAVGESRGHLAQQAVEELVQRRLGHVERLAASTLVSNAFVLRKSLRLTSCQNSVGDARCPEALQLAKRCGKAAEYAQLWPGTAQHQRRSC